MKKFFSIIIFAALCLSLFGCSRSDESLGGDIESETNSSFVEVSDPFIEESSNEEISNDTASETESSEVDDGFNYLYEMGFDDDYVEYMK